MEVEKVYFDCNKKRYITKEEAFSQFDHYLRYKEHKPNILVMKKQAWHDNNLNDGPVQLSLEV